MRQRETFYRGEELQRACRTMPARTYNLTRILLSRQAEPAVFVPIRSMQYLAVVETAEFNFVHSEARRRIEISWQHFRPWERTGLDDPVAYEAVYFSPGAGATMLRLQGEFARALELMVSRYVPAGGSAVIELKRR
jgi:hypothetical protein